MVAVMEVKPEIARDHLDHSDDGPQLVALGRRYRITLELCIPDADFSERDVREWVQHELLDTGSISASNPLYHKSPFDAELDDMLDKWMTATRQAEPKTWDESEALYKQFRSEHLKERR